MKALMKLPETDFMLCLYLLPVAVQKDAQIETLKSLWDKLETCQFKVPAPANAPLALLPSLLPSSLLPSLSPSSPLPSVSCVARPCPPVVSLLFSQGNHGESRRSYETRPFCCARAGKKRATRANVRLLSSF